MAQRSIHHLSVASSMPVSLNSGAFQKPQNNQPQKTNQINGWLLKNNDSMRNYSAKLKNPSDRVLMDCFRGI